jgi:hypothetical protein
MTTATVIWPANHQVSQLYYSLPLGAATPDTVGAAAAAAEELSQMTDMHELEQGR